MKTANPLKVLAKILIGGWNPFFENLLYFDTRKLSARFARASTFLAPAESSQRISDDPP